MTFSQIRQYVTGLLRKSFKNKEILDKISDNNGTIAYNGINISNTNPDATLSPTSENTLQNKVIYKALNDKVEKESGKGLSTNDFTNALKGKLEALSNYDDGVLTGKVSSLESNISDISNSISGINNKLIGKVDSEEGKGLSEENFTESNKIHLERTVNLIENGLDFSGNSLSLYFHYNPDDNLRAVSYNIMQEYSLKATDSDNGSPIPVNASNYKSFVKITNALITDLLYQVHQQQEEINNLESRIQLLENNSGNN